MKKKEKVLRVLGIYYMATGLWPLVHLTSFLWVTGPKTDVWLVKMVGLLTAAIGIALLAGTQTPTKVTLAIGAITAFICIDVFYVAAGVIPKIYLADAFGQLLLLILLLSEKTGRKNQAALRS